MEGEQGPSKVFGWRTIVVCVSSKQARVYYIIVLLIDVVPIILNGILGITAGHYFKCPFIVLEKHSA